MGNHIITTRDKNVLIDSGETSADLERQLLVKSIPDGQVCRKMSKYKSYMRLFCMAMAILSSVDGTRAKAEETDAKSIPKPILMLGLFCNSALSILKIQFEANPSAPPWKAVGSRKDMISVLMRNLITDDSAYQKAIRDQALTPGEAQFIKYSAIHESEQWLKNINNSCITPNLSSEDYEACLKETNSEIYKCYRQIIDSALAMRKSQTKKD